MALPRTLRPSALLYSYAANAFLVFDASGVQYVPFRYQLVLKMVCIAFTFCSAIPALLPIAALFMYFSYKIDRYNFLRVFKPPPRTTDRTVTYSVLYILPLAAFGHVVFAIFFYSKQARAISPRLLAPSHALSRPLTPSHAFSHHLTPLPFSRLFTGQPARPPCLLRVPVRAHGARDAPHLRGDSPAVAARDQGGR